uniref:Uncharacterized protein n=1 Tax=viral metagenome TaxID=1070528 RepID=A0A6M3KXU5_9ZZZZ
MLAFHFGWDIEYILSLSCVQMDLIFAGLIEILDMKYNTKRAEQEEFNRQAKISELQVKMLIDNKRKKLGLSKDEPVKLTLTDLMSGDKHV